MLLTSHTGYLAELACGVVGAAGGRKTEGGASAINHAFTIIPPYMLSARPEDLDSFREVEPFCVSANDLINPLPPSLFYGSGWHAHHPVAKSAQSDEDKLAYYWYATFPMSKLRVPIKVGSGTVAVWYVVEPRESHAETRISCWVDNNYRGAKQILGVRDVPDARPEYVVLFLFLPLSFRLTSVLFFFFRGRLTIIDRGVSEGSHYVECQLLGEEGRAVPQFKILGIFTT